MKVSMKQCKKRLAMVWLIGAGFLFFIVLVQTLLGRYGDNTSEVWGWTLPTIMPTLSLIIGVLVMDALGKGYEIDEIDAFLFRMTFGISIFYLFAVLLVIFIQPFSSLPPLVLMSQSNFWLAPFQGIVAATMGAFFVKAKVEREK